MVVERSKKGRLSSLSCKGDSDLDSSSGSEDSDDEASIDLVSYITIGNVNCVFPSDLEV